MGSTPGSYQTRCDDGIAGNANCASYTGDLQRVYVLSHTTSKLPLEFQVETSHRSPAFGEVSVVVKYKGEQYDKIYPGCLIKRLVLFQLSRAPSSVWGSDHDVADYTTVNAVCTYIRVNAEHINILCAPLSAVSSAFQSQCPRGNYILGIGKNNFPCANTVGDEYNQGSGGILRRQTRSPN